mgnify:CR=1 FL=1
MVKILKHNLLYLTEDLKKEIILEDIFDEKGNILVGKGTLINEYTLDILKKSNVKKVLVYPSKKRCINIPCNKTALEYKECRLVLQDIIIKMAVGKGVNPNAIDCIFESLSKEINHNREMIGYTNNIKDNDEYTYNHSVNVAVYSLFIGSLLDLNKEELRELCQAALLHDLGKSNIPNEILNKKGKLTKEEFELVKKHPLDGYKLSKEMPFLSEKVRYGILCHHEREDGSGYPYGIKGEEINLYAKIIAIGDVYDALTSERVYKEKSTPFEAIEEFYNMGFEKFDTNILNLFLKNIVQLYVNSKVELSNGRVGKIKFIHPNKITQPVVKIDGDYLKLWEDNYLKIEEIVG